MRRTRASIRDTVAAAMTTGRLTHLAAIVAGLTIALQTTRGLAQDSPRFNKQRVTFKNGDLDLVGYFFKPDGPGPFPAVVWNHGSEKNPGGGPQFDTVASIFVPAGYAVFAP